ncbi:MAG: TonB-dependent receptor [Hyphomicrobiaceae bacterium]|nr:TonB-dependent receptor [Hyphomicrobiaceae bacterium]
MQRADLKALRRRTGGRGVACALVAGIAVVLPAANPAAAQTQLPGIVVTSPSPVVRPPAAPSRPAPASTAAAIPQAPPAEASVAPAGDAAPPPPGSIVVVDDAFAPVTVATDREILANAGPTITDTLASKPGIIGSTFSPGSNRPVVRGLDTYRVRVQENGIGSHDVSALSEDHGVPIDPFSAERIEVVRGPATLRYGSQAIGGVVAVESNRIPMFIPPRGFSGELKGGLNSADMGRDGAFQATAGSGNIAIHVDAFRRRTFDYDTPQGIQPNSFVDAKGVALGASYIWTTGFLGVSWSRYQSLYGIPGEEALDHRPRIDLVQDKVTSKGEWRVRDYGIEAIRIWLGTTRYAHDEVVFEETEGIDIVGTRFTNREHEARAEMQHLPVSTALGELRGAAGIQWGRKRMAGFGVGEEVDGLLDPAARQRMIAGFLFEELEVTRRLRFQAAGRIEGNEADGTGVENPLVSTDPARFSKSFTPVSGSLGLLYELPLGIVARVTAQHTERAPDVGELFSKGVHEATGTFEIGNPNLDVEKADTIELGFKRSKGRMRFDTSVFHTVYDGFIFKSFTGRQCDDALATCGAGTELDELVFAQRDAAFTGAEVGGELDVAEIGRGVVGISGQYDFVRAHFEDGVNVPRIPPHRVGGGLYYRDPSWLARVFTLTALRQDTVSSIDSRDTPTNGYTLLNAELAYTFKGSSDDNLASRTTIGIKGENLLDDDVRNHVSFKKDEVLQPGRTIRLFGSIKLN